MVMNAKTAASEWRPADRTDAVLIRAIQDGLPLVERPYAAIGEAIGIRRGQRS